MLRVQESAIEYLKAQTHGEYLLFIKRALYTEQQILANESR